MNKQPPPRPCHDKIEGKQHGAREYDLDLFLNYFGDAIVVYDPDLRYTFINPAGAALLGLAVQEVIGRTNREIIGDAADTIERHLRRVLEIKGKVFALYETRLPGGTRLFDTAYYPVLNEAGEVLRVMGVCRDVTESRARIPHQYGPDQKQPGPLEQGGKTCGFGRKNHTSTVKTLREDSRHTEAVVTLAGGMAHRFNNALSAVMGNLDLIRLELLEMVAPNAREALGLYIERMEESLEHMGFITRQLLAYAQGGRYSPTLVPFETFLQYTIPLLGHTVGRSTHIESDLTPDLWSVEADTAQLQMILSALVQNASEAMDGRGRINIAAQNVDLAADSPSRPGELRPGQYVMLTVKDQGKGMDRETRARLFEPFFSTKLQGRGLGMAAVYGIVRNHGGWISVRSEPGRGTGVTIWLPALQNSKKKESDKSTGTGTTEAATVLVVEDEEPVMEVFRTVLERMGYRVVTASTGGKAMETAEFFPERIDLAILDILLPDMDGRRVYPELVRTRPDLKVIVTSGYSVEGPAQEILDAGAKAFLPKPFSLQQLREMITRVLGDAPPLSRRNSRKSGSGDTETPEPR